MLSFYYWSYITLSDYYSSLQCPFLNSGIVVKCVLKNNFKFCPKTPTSCHRIVLLHQELVNIEKQEWKLILVSRKKKLATFFPITVCCSTNLVWRSNTNLWNTVAKEWRTQWLAKQNVSYGHTIKIQGQWFIRVNWSCNVELMANKKWHTDQDTSFQFSTNKSINLSNISPLWLSASGSFTGFVFLSMCLPILLVRFFCVDFVFTQWHHRLGYICGSLLCTLIIHGHLGSV